MGRRAIKGVLLDESVLFSPESDDFSPRLRDSVPSLLRLLRYSMIRTCSSTESFLIRNVVKAGSCEDPNMVHIRSLEELSVTICCMNKKIPVEVMADLEPIKDNEEAVKAYGIHLGTEMCKKMLAHGIKSLHLYTLNMEKSALPILMNLGMIDESKISRSLPWRRPC